MSLFRHRALKVAAIGVGLLAAIGLFAGTAAVVWANRVLGGGKVREWVNGDPEKLYLEYRAASSSWPGRVRVRDLRLRGRDPNVEWEFRIEDCRITLSLGDLFRRRFHATSVEASGLRFHLRQRLEERKAVAGRVEPLPPIEGFPAVPLRSRPVIRPDEDVQGLWGVQIDRLSASPVREIWVDAYRYEGAARLTGKLYLLPRREAAVGPATLEWSGGELFLFGKRAASSMRARLECRIAPYDPREVRGSRVWDFISARADWSGELAGLEFLDALIGSEPHLSGGKGMLTGRLLVDRGRGEARLALAAKGAVARYAKDTLRGTVAGELRMSPWRPAFGVAEVSGSSLSLRDVETAAPGGSRSWWGRFDFVSGRLRSVRDGLSLSGEVRSRCRDARPLYTLFGVGLPRWTRGLMELDDFTGRADVDFAPRLLKAENLEARGGEFRITGRYARSGDATEGAFLIERPPLRVGVKIEGSTTRLRLFGARKWLGL